MKPSFDSIIQTASQVSALLGAPARVRVLLLLAQAPRSVESLATATSESMPNISQHLKKLTAAGLVRFEKEGTSRKYSLTDERLGLLIEDLFELSGRLTPLSPSAPQPDLQDWISIYDPALPRKLKLKKAILLDVRESIESVTTPIEGSVQIPLSELPRMLKDLATTPEYYLICSGRACPKASAGVDLLRKKGFQAFRIKEGPAALRLRPEKNST